MVGFHINYVVIQFYAKNKLAYNLSRIHLQKSFDTDFCSAEDVKQVRGVSWGCGRFF